MRGAKRGKLLRSMPVWAARILPMLLVLAEAGRVLARPGGGHTFGDGDDFGGGDGGGGDDGGGELIVLLLRLAFSYPELGLPLLLVGLFLWWRMNRDGAQPWATAHAVREATRPARSRGVADLNVLRGHDPDFSRVIFEDFCYRLYAASYQARADARALAALAPYLSEEVRREIVSEFPAQLGVSSVVVGALRIDSALVLPETEERESFVRLGLSIEANFTLGTAANQRTFYRRERWMLERAASSRTKPPEETAKLGCPNCGAPFSASDSNRCTYCQQVVTDGRFGWKVIGREVLQSVSRPPALSHHVEERGTSLATVRDGGFEQQLAELVAKDPDAAIEKIEARVRFMYEGLNRAWVERDLSRVRGLLSDGMFDSQRYWAEAYRAQGLQNVLEQMQISRLEAVKIVLDRYFDAVTVRIWASGLDFTIDVKSGNVVTGSRTRRREYTEYWTLIRGASVSGPARTDPSCPNCAAPLNVTMAGQCAHCGSHVTRGEFDWVLSKIEQDDVYVG